MLAVVECGWRASSRQVWLTRLTHGRLWREDEGRETKSSTSNPCVPIKNSREWVARAGASVRDARGIDKQPMEILLHIAECIEDAASLASFSAACTRTRYASLPSLYVRFFRRRGPAWVSRRLIETRDPLLEAPPDADVALAITLLGDLGRGLWQTNDLPLLTIKTRWRELQEPARDRHPGSTSDGADSEIMEEGVMDMPMRDRDSVAMDISLVHVAAACGLDELLRCLVTEEADLSATAVFVWTEDRDFRVNDTSPLTLAISNQRLSTAELLLELGVEAHDGWKTALRVGRADFVELLLRYDPELRTQELDRYHGYEEEENFGRPFSPLTFCLKVCTRDPVAIFRNYARYGFDTEESMYGADRLLPWAVVLGHKETAYFLAEELSTVRDIVPLFRLVALSAHEPAGRLAEGVLRAMARAGRVQGGTLPRGRRRHMPTVLWEVPTQALRDWARMDRLYRLFGIAEPVISQTLLPEKTVAGRSPRAKTYACAPSDADRDPDTGERGMDREILVRVQEDLDYVRSSARKTNDSCRFLNLDARVLHITYAVGESLDEGTSDSLWGPEPGTVGDWIEELKSGEDMRHVTGPPIPWPWQNASRPFIDEVWRRADILADLDRPDGEWRELVHRRLLEWALAAHHRSLKQSSSSPATSVERPSSLEFSVAYTGTESGPNDACKAGLHTARDCCLQYVEEGGEAGRRKAHKVVSILATGPCAKPGASKREMGTWHRAHEESLYASGIIDPESTDDDRGQFPLIDVLWGIIVRGHSWTLVTTGLEVEARPESVGQRDRFYEGPVSYATHIGSTETYDGILTLLTSLPVILAWVDRLYVGPLAARLTTLAGRQSRRRARGRGPGHQA
ncbi:hypothetical protein CMEL01_16731 [Colletotrichum melonis]|uniref:PD-(D/E)XK nuclease-like domain-containing protein n=1 Tax=Colletotrichum melonis TaxID=1209925 RepID=A0AAI9UDF7_9PEZI|nr:hypothetical protein CMEL01_16731 [Colletotrichum melonis]